MDIAAPRQRCCAPCRCAPPAISGWDYAVALPLLPLRPSATGPSCRLQKPTQRTHSTQGETGLTNSGLWPWRDCVLETWEVVRVAISSHERHYRNLTAQNAQTCRSAT